MLRRERHRISLRQRSRPAPFRGTALKALVRRAAARLSPEGSDLRILVVGDGEMARWNRACFGRARTTNVISFPEDDAAAGASRRLAGDILLSAPTCLAQTLAWPGTAEERVLFFIIHGMVHLLGHDHARGLREARRMRRLESAVYRAALAAAGGPDGNRPARGGSRAAALRRAGAARRGPR